jgi:D-serine deaminase-like pyridoxal phosphate-dependent protein
MNQEVKKLNNTAESQVSLGCSKADLDTPALCVDLDALESNIRHIADTCREHGVYWRPHTKCPKSPVIGHKLIEAGAIGLTCAKLGEAEVMAAAGIKDLLIANIIVGPQKVARLVELRRIADPIVCVDHADQVDQLSAGMAAAGLTLRVLVEVNIGLNRVGVEPSEPTLELARHVVDSPGLELAGIMGYEGHLLTVPDQDEKRQSIQTALDLLAETKDLLEKSGLACPIVSCGGTGSFRFSIQHPTITEVQAGGAIFMDEFYRHVCKVSGLDNALTVVTTVVSRPTQDRAIIDAGRKTFNQDHHKAKVIGRPGISVDKLSAEHGILSVAANETLSIGDRLELIPGYSDWTTVLHDRFYAFRGDRLEAIIPLEGRGKLQ